MTITPADWKLLISGIIESNRFRQEMVELVEPILLLETYNDAPEVVQHSLRMTILGEAIAFSVAMMGLPREGAEAVIYELTSKALSRQEDLREDLIAAKIREEISKAAKAAAPNSPWNPWK